MTKFVNARQPLAAMVFLGLIAQGCAHSGGVERLNSNQGAELGQRASGTPHKVVRVSAVWCSPCCELTREVFQSGAASHLLSNVTSETVDFDTEHGQEIVQRHTILSLPTTLILDERETELGRIEGFEGKEDFIARLAVLLAPGEPVNSASLSLDEHHSAGQEQLERARAFLIQGREAEALRLIDQIRKEDPDNESGAFVGASRLLGRYWIRARGLPERGVEALRLALETHPGHAGEAGTVYWLAKGLLEQGRLQEVDRALDGYVGANPGVDGVKLRATFLALNAPERPGALGAVEQALELDPKLDYCNYLLALVYEKQGALDKARVAVEVAIRLNAERALYRALADRLK